MNVFKQIFKKPAPYNKGEQQLTTPHLNSGNINIARGNIITLAEHRDIINGKRRPKV